MVPGQLKKMDAGAQRMREFQPEVNRLAADPADRLRRIDLLFVRLELCPLRAVVIRPQIRAGSCSVRHGFLLSMKRTRAFGVRSACVRA